MYVLIRSVSGATPVIQRPITIVQGEPHIEVSDLADLWRLAAETENRIAIDTDNGAPMLLVIDDYLD